MPSPTRTARVALHVGPGDMLRPATIDEFRHDPIGRVTIGPTFAVWCLNATLCGTMYWGWPSVADVHVLLPLFEIDSHPRMRPPFDVLSDGRFVEGIDPQALEVLSTYLLGRLPEYATRIRRNAVVYPDDHGLVSVVLAGLYPRLAPGHAWATFGRMDEALGWLDRADVVEVVPELARLSKHGDPALATLAQLRALLATELPRKLRVREVARRLGMSERSLQRALRELGVTYRAEVTEARIRRARSSVGKAADIAKNAGFASKSGLNAARRRTKEPAKPEARRKRGT